MWARADGRPVDQAAMRQVHAQCRAEAIAAGARYGRLRVIEAYAQALPYDGGVPAIDFSPIGRLGDVYGESRARARQQALQEEMIRAAMHACMSRNGYLEKT